MIKLQHFGGSIFNKMKYFVLKTFPDTRAFYSSLTAEIISQLQFLFRFSNSNSGNKTKAAFTFSSKTHFHQKNAFDVRLFKILN